MPAPTPIDTNPRIDPADLAIAVADYLEVSRSSLRTSDPDWFDHVEDAAWQRLCAAAGLGRAPGSAVRSLRLADVPPRAAA